MAALFDSITVSEWARGGECVIVWKCVGVKVCVCGSLD